MSYVPRRGGIVIMPVRRCVCALRPQVVGARRPRAPKYGPKAVAALVLCWSVLGMPAGKRLAPMLGELVAVLRRFGELDIDEDTAALLAGMSAATIDRRLAPERKKYAMKGRSRTKPGTLLKSQIPVRTWADWDDAVPGFVEIDLVSHDGGNPAGEHAWTLTVTDIATGWTENRSLPSKALKGVMAALDDITAVMPFPIRGIDSDNGSEFINFHLLDWCCKHQITFTRSRAGNKNDGCHVEQKNWTTVRILVGYHRYDTPAELLLLNKIWTLQSLLTNYFYPQQKLVLKVRDGAKITKKHDTATTPHRRAQAHPNLPTTAKAEPDPHLPRHQPRRPATPDPRLDERTTHPGHHQSRTPTPSTHPRGHQQTRPPISCRGHPAHEATNTVAGILT